MSISMQAEALKLVFKEIDTQDVDEVTFEACNFRILEFLPHVYG